MLRELSCKFEQWGGAECVPNDVTTAGPQREKVDLFY